MSTPYKKIYEKIQQDVLSAAADDDIPNLESDSDDDAVVLTARSVASSQPSSTVLSPAASLHPSSAVQSQFHLSSQALRTFRAAMSPRPLPQYNEFFYRPQDNAVVHVFNNNAVVETTWGSLRQSASVQSQLPNAYDRSAAVASGQSPQDQSESDDEAEQEAVARLK